MQAVLDLVKKYAHELSLGATMRGTARGSAQLHLDNAADLYLRLIRALSDMEEEAEERGWLASERKVTGDE